MKNLAGAPGCDNVIIQELTRCGIAVVHGKRRRSEVAATVTGKLGNFTFTRLWYYYNVHGNVPLAVAEELYADPVGRVDIRVVGHCACPPPEAPWLTWFTPDGHTVVPVKEEEGFRDFAKRGLIDKSLLDTHVFSDDPASLGAKAYVTNYHIDTELGLYKFAEALKRHGLAA